MRAFEARAIRPVELWQLPSYPHVGYDLWSTRNFPSHRPRQLERRPQIRLPATPAVAGQDRSVARGRPAAKPGRSPGDGLRYLSRQCPSFNSRILSAVVVFSELRSRETRLQPVARSLSRGSLTKLSEDLL